MKVSLIFPKPPDRGIFCGTVKEAEQYVKEKIDFYGFPPMGILYLATYLSENNFDVSIYLIRIHTMKSILNILGIFESCCI